MGLLKANIVLMVLFVVTCFTFPRLAAQEFIKQGFSVEQIPVKKILNSKTSAASLSGLANKVTIIDFFGTWCAPCLRALPHLTELKNEFDKDLNVVLVSSESEEQLQKFLSKRPSFPFPIIVDGTNEWNSKFQPPSLPYTVVVKEDKIIAATEAQKITKEAVQSWLGSAPETATATKQTEPSKPVMSANKKSSNSVISLSQDFIYAAKTGESIDNYESHLAKLPYDELQKRAATDDEKKAFWINVYNGYTQAALKLNPDQYKNRNAFFRQKKITVAGEAMSLDDIEHGILRHSKIKWSLGHLGKLFPSKREKELRVQKLDYRIHFALNCGAKSCPPIAFYSDETMNTQLDIATKAYLTGEARYDSVKNIVYLPKLMSWFRGDFGGKGGMKKILQQFNIIPPDADPKVKFNDYDWTLTLNNYRNQDK